MSTFKAAPFSYSTIGTLIPVRISATNGFGTSSTSTANTSGADYRTVPAAMGTVSRDSSSTASSIILNWSAQSGDSQTGGSAVLGYHLVWDNGDGATPDTNLIGHTSTFSDLTYTIASGLTTGSEYKFMIRSKNIYGFGDYSSVVTIKVAAVPS